ncbi:DMT family transporter [Pseudoruegeria sp. HB172150]|uniref:DMT family transporter n=1 Tax=Pseudoruegeria sp. HB172150 TaxID=2721164 RepID=UPI00155449B3|nr:DMT family transporter [Pseudoruegeria sp. HB172150]
MTAAPAENRALLFGAVLLFGAGWGLGQPFNKIAVSGGWQPYAIIFWQGIISSVMAFGICRLRGKSLPRTMAQWRTCAGVAVLGTMIPHFATYTAVAHLPAGVMSVVLSTVPIVSMPMAVAFGNDRLSARRIAGLLSGLTAVCLIILSRPSEGGAPVQGFYVLIALIAPCCYALNGNLLARYGRAGLDPVQVMLGSALIAIPVALPLALATGQFRAIAMPPPTADLAMIAVALIHTCVYIGNLWLIGRAGPVFTSQITYFITGFGMLWSMLILAERYPPLVWAALLLMLGGLFLVQPRRARSAPVTEPVQ